MADTTPAPKVGDIDPTPDWFSDTAPPCDEAAERNGSLVFCTWPTGHDDLTPHVAGNGQTIVAVWTGDEDT